MIGVTSAREALDVFEKAGDTVEVGEVGDYKTIMNPKMFDRLTQEQKERVDPKKAKLDPTRNSRTSCNIVTTINRWQKRPTKVDSVDTYLPRSEQCVYTTLYLKTVCLYYIIFKKRGARYSHNVVGNAQLPSEV